MSEAPDLSEAEALAAEHALGVLSERRMAGEPGFAALVEAWRARLAPLLDAVAAVGAPAGLWPRIERALPANDNAAGRRRLRFWRGATVGSLGLAAASMAMAVMLANRPPVLVQPPAPAPLLNASLAPTAGAQPLFIAAYDPVRKALIITSLVPPGTDPVHVHQLWLIPADGKPHSLGMVEPGTSKAMPMPEGMIPMLQAGAALAISVEPPGGSPTKDAPSGPIAAIGKLSKI
ncbi:MAG: anti-sigma factor [Phenylobacterium sp.]